MRVMASRRVNCGSGDYPLPGFCNLDADPSKPADIHATVPPLPFDDACLDEIYAGHFLEHLTYDDGQAFLKECYRCLVPGGKLGLVVPDMREVLKRWLAGSIDAMEYPWGVFHRVSDLDAVCRVFLYGSVQESQHRWSYERDTLARAMVGAGFRQLKEIDRYTDPRLAAGAWYQCGVEGRKPEGEA
jgi:predicted SAM-dependent methyltransferase